MPPPKQLNAYGPPQGGAGPLTWQELMNQQIPIQQRVAQNVATGEASGLPPLDPASEESALKKIGLKTLGGIGYVGSLVDKYTGGRAVRGLLGGHPQELLSLIPGSDAFGITDEANRVSGRDLSDKMGLSDKDSDSFLDTLKGVGVDLLTSPSTYLGLPGTSLTAEGAQVAKLGALPGLMKRLRGFQNVSEFGPEAAAAAARAGVDLNSLVGKPLGGLTSIGIPFGPKAVLGASPEAADALSAVGKTAKSVASTVGNLPGINTITHPLAALYGAVKEPIRTYGKALFDYRVKSATSAAGQKAAQQATAGEEAGLAASRGHLANMTRSLDALGALDQPGMIRSIAEGAQGATSPLDLNAPNIGLRGRQINEQIEAGRGFMNDLRERSRELGRSTPELEDMYAQYWPRQVQLPDVSTPGYGGYGGRGKIFDTQPRALGQREEILKNIPGGTEGAINPLTADPEVSGILGRFGPKDGVPGGLAPTTPLQREEIVRRKYLGFMPEDEAMIPQLQSRLDEINKSKAAAGQSRAYANEWAEKAAKTADPKDIQEASKWNNIAGTEASYATQLAAQKGLSQQENLLLNRFQQSKSLTRWAESLDPKYADEGLPFFGRHPLTDLESKVASTIRSNEASDAIHSMYAELAVPQEMAGPGFVPIQEALKRAGFENVPQALAQFAKRRGFPGDPAELGLTHYLPPEVVSDATRFTNGFQIPDVLKPLVALTDWATNLTKTFQTTPFPAFHVRNFISGMFSNYMLGAHDPRYSQLNPLAWIKPVQDAYSLIKGHAIEGASEIPLFRGMNLSDAEATKKIADLAFQHRAAGLGSSMASEALTGIDQAEGLTSRIPGMQPYPGMAANAKEYFDFSKPNSRYPLNVAGVNANRSTFGPVVAGKRFGDATEEVNRLSGLIAQLRQGYDPAVAATRTRAAQVDYSALSSFEKNVMRRLVPFYSYTRGIVPFVLENLAHNPGGLGANTAAAAYEMRSQNKEFVPDYLGNGLAVPFGKEENGTQRFLTRMDNPVEAAAQLYNGGGLDKTMMGLLGQMNPLIKGGLEFATGKQFFTGRDLADLYPMSGNSLMDQAIMNSPLSRLASTYNTLTDERKWEHPLALATNLGTGVKLSDIDMERQRDLAARDFISDRLRGQQGIGRFETLYPRSEAIQSLTPEQIALLRLSKTLEQRAEKQAKENKAGRIGLRSGG